MIFKLIVNLLFSFINLLVRPRLSILVCVVVYFYTNALPLILLCDYLNLDLRFLFIYLFLLQNYLK